MNDTEMSGVGDGTRVPADTGEKDRKTEIREKARSVFLRYGYRKATLDDIGKACGLSKTAIYHYFTDKETVFAEVVRAESVVLLSKMRAAAASTADPKARLAEVIRTRFRAMSEILNEVVGDAGHEVREFLPKAAHAREEFFHEEGKLIEEILEDGGRQGVFRVLRTRNGPLLLIAALQGVENGLAGLSDSLSIEEAIDEMLEILFDGLCR